MFEKTLEAKETKHGEIQAEKYEVKLGLNLGEKHIDIHGEKSGEIHEKHENHAETTQKEKLVETKHTGWSWNKLIEKT
jgi:hypothetical protein